MESNIEKLLDKTGLNWSVRTEKIQTESGITIPKSMGIIREDTNTVIGLHTESYHPYQNEQMMELLYRVTKTSGHELLEVHSGGTFKNGGRVFVQLKSNDLKLGSDKIEGYITGVNSFDGSTSLGFGPSSKTISCQNTFFGVYKGLEKVRHTKSLEIKVEEICRRIDGVIEEEKQIFDNIIKLSETRFDDVIKESVLRKLFDIDKNIDIRDDESLSTLKRNQLSRYYIDLNGELQQKGDNLWGLFSGVTKYTTHSIGKGDNSENKMFGTYGQREREIFKGLVELV